MSDEDISAGSRWLAEVSNQLSEARVGIICVTPENQANQWLLFEAGALSKTLDQTFVCPILFELSPGQLAGPLAQFQANEINHGGTEKVLNTLNKALNENQLAAEDLTEILEVWWPKLDARLKEMPPASEAKPQKRSVENILEEIVENTREQIRRENIRLEGYREKDSKMDDMLELLRSSMTGLQQFLEQSKTIPDLLAEGAKLGDLVRLARELPTPDLSRVQRMLASMKGMSEANRLETENLLKPPPESGGTEGEKS